MTRLSPTWDQMNARLDMEMPQKKKRRFFTWFWAIICCLVCGGLLFLNSSKTGIKAGILQKSSSVQKTMPDQPLLPIKNVSASPISADNQNEKVSRKSLAAIHDEKTKQPVHDRFGQVRSFQLSKSLVISSKEKSTKNELNLQGDFKPVNKKLAVIFQNNISDKSMVLQSPFDKKNEGSIPTITPLPMAGLATDSAFSKTTNIDSIFINTRQKRIAKNPGDKIARWRLYATIAPDFLLGNIQPLHSPGYYAGGGADYIFNSHFSIRTGVLFNHSKISTTGDNYSYIPSKNLPLYYKIELKDVKGYFNYLEVPLSLRYTIQPGKKVSFNISTGLSSVFFLKKNCTYNLLLNGWQQEYWHSEDDDSGDNSSKNILNNLRIGFGTSFKLLKKFSLEIEPSFKLPFEEIGENRREIGSFALNLNLIIPVKNKK